MMQDILTTFVVTRKTNSLFFQKEVPADLSFIEEPHKTPAALRATHDSHRRRFLSPHLQPLPWALHSFGFHPKPLDVLTWSFSAKDDFSAIPGLLQGLISTIRQFADQGQFPLNVGLKVNFTAATGVPMCPGKGDQPGHVANFSLVGIVGTPGWAEFLEEMKKSWSAYEASFPHWSSSWSSIPNVDEHLRRIYDADFTLLREQLEQLDRDGVFMNERFRTLLFPNLEGYRAKYIRDRQAMCI